MSADMSVGSYVVYGLNGVCRVDSLTKMKFGGDRHGRMYYVLKPVGNPTSTLFLPADSECISTKVRSVMTKDEIDSLLNSARGGDYPWNSDRRRRTEDFQRVLTEGVRRDMLLMVHCLYCKKKEFAGQNKNLSMSDERVFRTAEKLVKDEFSFSLGIDPEDVGAYIRDILN